MTSRTPTKADGVQQLRIALQNHAAVHNFVVLLPLPLQLYMLREAGVSALAAATTATAALLLQCLSPNTFAANA